MSEETSPPSQGIQVLLGFLMVVGSDLIHLAFGWLLAQINMDGLVLMTCASLFLTPILIGLIVRSSTGWTGFLPGTLIGILVSIAIPCSAIYIFCSSMRF